MTPAVLRKVSEEWWNEDGCRVKRGSAVKVGYMRVVGLSALGVLADALSSLAMLR